MLYFGELGDCRVKKVQSLVAVNCGPQRWADVAMNLRGISAIDALPQNITLSTPHLLSFRDVQYTKWNGCNCANTLELSRIPGSEKKTLKSKADHRRIHDKKWINLAPGAAAPRESHWLYAYWKMVAVTIITVWYCVKTWCHIQNRKYITYRNIAKRWPSHGQMKCVGNFMKFEHMFLRYARGQTETHKRVDLSTLHPYRCKAKYHTDEKER